MATRRGGSHALAGWLFADLLLVFGLMMLGTQTGRADPVRPRSTGTPTTTTTQPPTTTVPPRPVGVEQQPHVLVVDTRADAAQQVRDQLRAQRIEGRRAAIVLSFGIASTVGVGKPYATAVNQAIRAGLPEVFGGALMRDYWGAPKANPAGFVELEIYLFTS